MYRTANFHYVALRHSRIEHGRLALPDICLKQRPCSQPCGRTGWSGVPVTSHESAQAGRAGRCLWPAMKVPKLATQSTLGRCADRHAFADFSAVDL